jgi:hypothetical protein
MATWKKVLTHDSAVSDTEGLKINAGSAGETSKTIVLSDGSNTDVVTIAVSTGLSIAQSGDVITLTNTVVNTDTQLTEEEVQDFAWNVLGGTQTGITVTYQDAANDVNFVVDDQDLSTLGLNGNINVTLSQPTSSTTLSIVSGDNVTLTNAPGDDGFAIAVTDSDIQGALETETLEASQSGDNVVLTNTGSAGETDTITLVAGDGITLTADNAGSVTIDADAAGTVEVTDTDDDITVFPMFASASSGAVTVYVDSSTISYNPSSDTLTVGNLTVEGTQTTLNTTELVVADKNIVLASEAGSAANANGAGITIDAGGSSDPGITWKNGSNLTGWHVDMYNGGVDFPIAIMQFGATATAPSSSDNAAGRGSFYTTTDGRLYFRTDTVAE